MSDHDISHADPDGRTALIAEVVAQEERLQFSTFTNDDAWILGSRLRLEALERRHAITIDIARGEQQLGV